MAGKEIDSLFISIGLDPRDLEAGMSRLDALLEAAMVAAGKFADGFEEGWNNSISGLDAVANSAQDVGDALKETGGFFKFRVDKVHKLFIFKKDGRGSADTPRALGRVPR